MVFSPLFTGKPPQQVQVVEYTEKSQDKHECRHVQLVREYGFHPRSKVQVVDGALLPRKFEPFPQNMYGRPLEEIDNFIYEEVSKHSSKASFLISIDIAAVLKAFIDSWFKLLKPPSKLGQTPHHVISKKLFNVSLSFLNASLSAVSYAAQKHHIESTLSSSFPFVRQWVENENLANYFLLRFLFLPQPSSDLSQIDSWILISNRSRQKYLQHVLNVIEVKCSFTWKQSFFLLPCRKFYFQFLAAHGWRSVETTLVLVIKMLRENQKKKLMYKLFGQCLFRGTQWRNIRTGTLKRYMKYIKRLHDVTAERYADLFSTL